MEETAGKNLIKEQYLLTQKWNYNEKLVYLVILCFSLYGINRIFDYIVFTMFFALCAYLFYKNCLEILFIPLSFFSYVLNLEPGSIPFARVYELIFVVYVVISLLYRQKIKVSYYCVAIIFLAAQSLLYIKGIASIIATFFNFFMVFVIHSEINNNKKNMSLFLAVLAITAVSSGVYGILSGTVVRDPQYGYRYTSTISDPNYSALYYCIGIIGTITTDRFSKLQKSVVCIFLIWSLLRTVSISGFLIIAIVFIVYYLAVKSGNKIAITGLIICILFFLFLNVQIPSNLPGGSIQKRIINNINILLRTGNLNRVSSGRYNLTGLYFNYFKNNVPLIKKFFGGAFFDIYPHGIGEASQFNLVSHNSYIDILIEVGYLGALLMLSFCIVETAIYYKKFKASNDILALGMVLIKITFFGFLACLTMFPGRLAILGLFV